MIHIDKEGNVIGSFDPPQGHGMAVDDKGFVYIGNGYTVRKYDPKTGKLLAKCRGRRKTSRAAAVAAKPPMRVHAAHSWKRRPRPGGNISSSAAAGAEEPEAAAPMPKLGPRRCGVSCEISADDADDCGTDRRGSARRTGARTLRSRRLPGRARMVFDLDTFAFKRGWGAYGHALSEITTDDKDRAYTADGPEPKEFKGHLTLNISNDGLVYAADRAANRIIVTTKQGKFVKEFVLAPYTTQAGSTGGVMFSPDKAQRFLYISDLTNNHVWFLNREDGKVLGTLGSMGQNGGQFFGLHMIAVDSKGDIYTGEVFNGERVQRFVPVK